MAFYIFRKMIRKLPGVVIKEIAKPLPEITEGFGSRAEVGKICKKMGLEKVLLVTDKTLYSLGFLSKITESLETEKVNYTVFSEINSEPNVPVVEKGRRAAIGAGAQAIVALGGGSVLDSCKMIAAGMHYRKRSIRSLLMKFLIIPGKTVPVICIPSTAGTGAEITVGAVVSKGKTKSSTVIYGLNVTDVILDSELTVKAPQNVTSACAIDALSHGLEGVVADVHVSADDKYKSFDCVKLVLENLPVLLMHPDNIEARQLMGKAALYGGNAINKQLAGYVHAFAHTIGAKYKIAHGNAIALCLIPVMEYQKGKCGDSLAELAYYCDIATSEEQPEFAADKMLDTIGKLIDSCKFADRGEFIPKRDYRTLARQISRDSINYSMPIVFTTADIYRILDRINGK